MKNIVLVGFTGSGKSTIAKRTAKELNYIFYDTDVLICERYNSTIQEIIDRYGKNHYHTIVTEILADISKFSPCVIACGSDIVEKDENISVLKENSIIFYLYASLETIENRLSLLSGTPIIAKIPHETLEKTYNINLNLYKKYSDFTIDTENKRRTVIADEVISIYSNELIKK